MNKNSTIERLYTLGNFQNIKIINTINDIPENICLDEKLMETIIDIQILETEHAYASYTAMIETLEGVQPENIKHVLQEVKEQKYAQFLEALE